MDDRTDAQLDSSLIPQPSSLSSLRFRPYPKYKYSGVEWLGEIPAHWKILPFKRLFSVIYRYPTYYGIEYVPEGVPEIRGEAISENGDIIELDDQRSITAELSQQYPHTILTVGDLVMSVRGTMGKVGLVDKRYEKANITANLLRLSPRSQVALGKFLVFAFSSLYFRQQLDRQSPQTTIKTITVPQLSSIPVVTPPKEDQTRIVEFIVNETSKIDAFVAKKERLIELLQEKRTALITHAVTKGLDPDVPMQNSGVEWLGEIPAHWEVKQLKRLWKRCDYGVSENISGAGEIRVLTMGHLQDGEVVLPEEGSLEEVPEEFILDRSDLLFNRTNSRDLVAKVGIFRGDRSDRASFASYLVRLTASEDASPEYLNYLLNSGVVLSKARSMALLSVNQANLNPTKYGQLSVPIPPKAEQEYILAVLNKEASKLKALIQRIREAIDRLREFRTALISAAVIGKIDVRGEVA